MRINERELVWFARTSKRVDAQGYLTKRGVVNTNAKRRWFVLKGNLLFYYKSQEDMNAAPIGLIILERCRVETSGRFSEADQFEFKLVFDGSDTREYQLAAETEDDMMRWMKLITEASYEYLRAVVSDLRRRVEEEEKKLQGQPQQPQQPQQQQQQQPQQMQMQASSAEPAASSVQGEDLDSLPSATAFLQRAGKSQDISEGFVDLGDISGAQLHEEEADPNAPVAPPRKAHLQKKAPADR